MTWFVPFDDSLRHSDDLLLSSSDWDDDSDWRALSEKVLVGAMRGFEVDGIGHELAETAGDPGVPLTESKKARVPSGISRIPVIRIHELLRASSTRRALFSWACRLSRAALRFSTRAAGAGAGECAAVGKETTDESDDEGDWHKPSEVSVQDWIMNSGLVLGVEKKASCNLKRKGLYKGTKGDDALSYLIVHTERHTALKAPPFLILDVMGLAPHIRKWGNRGLASKPSFMPPESFHQYCNYFCASGRTSFRQPHHNYQHKEISKGRKDAQSWRDWACNLYFLHGSCGVIAAVNLPFGCPDKAPKSFCLAHKAPIHLDYSEGPSSLRAPDLSSP